MILYGRNPVREALRGRRRVLRAWAAEPFDWLSGVDVSSATPGQIEERCGSPDHQGVCAEAEPYPYADARSLLEAEDALVVCLDQVQDPHNLGAVCRASAGAVEHIAVARVRNLADWLGEAKQAGAWAYGAEAGARVAYDQPDYSGRVVLVLGSEGRGLRPRVAEACDELVALPRRGQVESLNVSTAAAALLYGILQFRKSALDKGS